LLELLRVPLAATILPWSEGDGEPVSNPFALLSALRRHAYRISLFCHAGAIKVPPRRESRAIRCGFKTPDEGRKQWRGERR